MFFSTVGWGMEKAEQGWKFYEKTLKTLTDTNADQYDQFLDDLIYKSCNTFNESYFEILLSNYNFPMARKVISFCKTTGYKVDFTSFIIQMSQEHSRLQEHYKTIAKEIDDYQLERSLRFK